VQLFGEAIGVRAWLMLARCADVHAEQHRRVRYGVFTAFLYQRDCLCASSPRCEAVPAQYVSYVLLSLAVMTKGPVASCWQG
jgi:hypothetical protein